MDLGAVLTYINYVVNRDQLGEPYSAKDFQMLIKVASKNYYEEKYNNVLELAQAEGNFLSAKLFQHSPLAHFLKDHVFDYGNIEIEVFPLPDDHGKTIDASAYFENVWRPAVFLTVSEYNSRRQNILTPNPRRKPFFCQKADGYEFVPNAIRRFRLTYLRAAIEPYFDYCIGLNDDDIYYMPPGSNIKKFLVSDPIDDEGDGDLETRGAETEPSYNLYDKSNKLMVKDVVHFSDPVEYPYYSKSVELDWVKDDRTKVADLLIAVATTRSRELNVAQIAAQV